MNDVMCVDNIQIGKIDDFLKMLDECMNLSIEKRIKTHRQLVMLEDWKYLSQLNGWRLVQDYGEHKMIECDIHMFSSLIIQGMQPIE